MQFAFYVKYCISLKTRNYITIHKDILYKLQSIIFNTIDAINNWNDFSCNLAQVAAFGNSTTYISWQ